MDEFDKFAIAATIVWLVGILLSLGLAGVVVWAIVKVVLHFT